jgi:hypothetical protein
LHCHPGLRGGIKSCGIIHQGIQLSKGPQGIGGKLPHPGHLGQITHHHPGGVSSLPIEILRCPPGGGKAAPAVQQHPPALPMQVLGNGGANPPAGAGD